MKATTILVSVGEQTLLWRVCKEQLDITGFKDKGTGISRELQRAATRSQDSRLKKLLSAFRDISS